MLPVSAKSVMSPFFQLKRLFVERLADQIIFASRNTTCICVHSRTDKEHYGPFLGTFSSVKTRHRPCWWMFASNARAFLGTSRDDAGSLEGRRAAEIRRTPHPSSSTQASARQLLHPACPLARAQGSSTSERLSSRGSFCLWTHRSDQTTAGHKLRLRQQWLPLGNSFRNKPNLPIGPSCTSASVAIAEVGSNRGMGLSAMARRPSVIAGQPVHPMTCCVPDVNRVSPRARLDEAILISGLLPLWMRTAAPRRSFEPPSTCVSVLKIGLLALRPVAPHARCKHGVNVK